MIDVPPRLKRVVHRLITAGKVRWLTRTVEFVKERQ
jgi:hypothetical protein